MGLDESGQRRIRNLVAQELRARGLAFELGEDEVVLQSSEGQITTRGLQPLAEACLFLEPSEWSARVHDLMEAWLVDDDPGPKAQWSDLVRSWPPRPAIPNDQTELSAPPSIAPDDGEEVLEATLPPSPVPRLSPRPSQDGAGQDAAFAENPAPAPGDEDLEVPDSLAPPALVPLVDDQERAPGPAGRPPPRPRPRGGLLRYGVYLAAIALLVSAGLETRAYFVGPADADWAAGVVNDVLLEATPLGSVSVVSELDGNMVGVAPLRFLVPAGPPVHVLLSSPGRLPKRVRLPSSGALRVELERLPETAAECTLELPGGGVWRYQNSDGDLSDDKGELPLRGTGVVRIVPGGFGAWIVKCPTEGGLVSVDLRRRRPPTVEARLLGPRGSLAYLRHQPIGTIPQRWQQAQTFAQVHIRTVEGIYTMRWVALPGVTEIRMPTSDAQAPTPTLPGSDLADPVPNFLRSKR